MFPRSASRTVGQQLAAMRNYADTPAKDPLFFSNLLNRIEKANQESTKIKANAAKAGEKKPQNAFKGPKNNKGPQNAKKPASGAGSRKVLGQKVNPTVTARVNVKDHPLNANTFKLMDESNFQRKKTGNRPYRDASRRPAINNRGPRASLRGPPRGKSLQSVPEIKTKELKSSAYNPDLSGSTFLYGHSTSTVSSLHGRLTSVVKEAVLKLKYPYKLPKSIIEQLQPSDLASRFVASKDYNLDVNQDEIASRIRQVVKGEVQQLDVDEKKFSTPESLRLAQFSRNQLMKNGALSMSAKEAIFGVASGLQLPKDLVAEAHWNK